MRIIQNRLCVMTKRFYANDVIEVNCGKIAELRTVRVPVLILQSQLNCRDETLQFRASLVAYVPHGFVQPPPLPFATVF